MCPAELGCLWPHGCSGRRRARPPARLGGLTSFGAAPRSPPVPSGPSGALHTSGAGSLIGGSARRLEARPGPAGLAAASNRSGCLCAAWPGPATAHGRRSQALQSLRRRASKPGPSRLSLSDFARNSSMAHSNIEFTSLGLQRFSRILKNDRVKLRAKFGWRWCRRRSRVPQPGPPVPAVPSVPVRAGVL